MRVEPSACAIFLHIPKTAGTTLHRVIERQYPPKAILSFGPDAHRSIREFRALSETRRRQIRMLKGHMGFGLHTDLPSPAVYFTLVRDPVERVLSHYHHILRDPNHYLFPHTDNGRLGLAAFLESGIPVMLDNGQTRLISGVWETVPFGGCDDSILQAAKRHIREHFVVVGLVEQFDETLCLLQDALGWWNPLSYVRRNVAEDRPRRHDLSAETLDVVIQNNRLDMELYAYAKRLFQERVRQWEGSLSARLETLRVSCAVAEITGLAEVKTR